MADLTAIYTSTTNQPEPQTFSISLPTMSTSPSTDDRVAYLVALQSSIQKLQGDVNTFLTEKMEQDKAIGIAKAEEAKDEENYGEEVVEAD
jgi:hypothetical protein